MSTAPKPSGTLDTALANAKKLLETQPALAVEQALEILKVIPQHPPALFLLASALSRVGRGDAAIEALRSLIAVAPGHSEAWRVLADHLAATGDSAGADAAYARHIRASTRHPELQRAALAMTRNDIPVAESLLKSHLTKTPTDVPAIRMLAEVAMRIGREGDARNLLERAIELAPGFMAARYQLAVLLHRQNEASRALVEIERLLATEPRNPAYRNLAAVILSRVGEYERSSRIYAELLKEYPANAKVWLSFGHVLKTEGRTDESVVAYRRSIARDPAFGEAYWSLANLKTFRFSETDVAEMTARLADAALDAINRLQFHFALGKAFEDAGDYAQSFTHYSKGNELHHARIRYDAHVNSERTARLKSTFTRAFFAERTAAGNPTREPIFIVGMPRSGSTLIEQILSSHSAVEGTTELPEIISMAKELRGHAASDRIGAYSDTLGAMNAEELRGLGEQYIERTRIYRKTGRPYFIDKMPNNFLHAGMIHLVLPNARIIDARRHPLACCFSNFKQHYARGQRFSYDLTDLGRYYRDYVELMAHFDDVLPARIHRVTYERMVEDTETEVRRLLDYCGLEFEPACLRFFENERGVRTASAEQVRQPIYREGIDHWRHYAGWLDPLKAALGDVLATYPAVPRFDPI